jgi:anion-transporting  ArsA/GET3 family ATPase
MSSIRVLVLCTLLAVLALTTVHALDMDAEMDLDMDMDMSVEGAPLARPLIDGVLSSPYKRGQLASYADIVKAEPGVAKLEKADDEDDWNGEKDEEDRFAYEKKLKEELRSLTALVKQSKAIIKVLPEKEMRIETIKNKLEALRNEYAKEDAVLKYKQQRALMKKIAKQELALQERVNSLKNTEVKLNGNIVKHKKTLRDVGVREAEMKILDM